MELLVVKLNRKRDCQNTDVGLLLVIDKLGNNLEFAAHSQATEDLYLLHQLAELPSGERDPKVFMIGLFQ
jgi:hypothetical protein